MYTVITNHKSEDNESYLVVLPIDISQQPSSKPLFEIGLRFPGAYTKYKHEYENNRVHLGKVLEVEVDIETTVLFVPLDLFYMSSELMLINTIDRYTKVLKDIRDKYDKEGVGLSFLSPSFIYRTIHPKILPVFQGTLDHLDTYSKSLWEDSRLQVSIFNDV
jgi:hypothetical protein